MSRLSWQQYTIYRGSTREDDVKMMSIVALVLRCLYLLVVMVVLCVCRIWLDTWYLLRVLRWMLRTMLAGHLSMRLAAVATVKWQSCCYTMEQMPILAPETGQGTHVQLPSPVHPTALQHSWWGLVLPCNMYHTCLGNSPSMGRGGCLLLYTKSYCRYAVFVLCHVTWRQANIDEMGLLQIGAELDYIFHSKGSLTVE